MKRKYIPFLLLILFYSLLHGCSPANQPGTASPSNVVEQPEQEQPTADTIAGNKTNSTMSSPGEPEKTTPAEQVEQLPKKLTISGEFESTIQTEGKEPITFGTARTKALTKNVLHSAEPISTEQAKEATYPYLIYLHNTDGQYYGEYALDLQAKQMRVGQDYYQLTGSAVATITEYLSPSIPEKSSMLSISLGKKYPNEEDGILITTTAIYPDYTMAVLKEDPSVSVIVFTQQTYVVDEEYIIDWKQYWKSADGKQLLFDQSANLLYESLWHSNFLPI